jgi:hypothetical protein
MTNILIAENTLKGWAPYAQTVGFVPDPMILRAGEIFLSGADNAVHMQRGEAQVWNALEQNIDGIIEFFNIVVTRDAIPLFTYEDTFTTPQSLENVLSFMVQRVQIAEPVYRAIKAGALLNLAHLDFSRLDPISHLLSELDAFRYDWQPRLDVYGADELEEARSKFANLAGPTLTVAQFLLGSLIFSGFAQASHTTHYIQPKRSRFTLGLTAVPDKIRTLGHQEEGPIFQSVEHDLAGSKLAWSTPAIPPILPYLVAYAPDKATPLDLLLSALDFRNSPQGQKYRELVRNIRADGLKARRLEDLVRYEREQAIEMLQPYSKLEKEHSRSLEIEIPLPFGGKAKFHPGIPKWLTIFWNDNVPFGGISKTLRRMWMHAEAYTDFAGKLRTVWTNG